MGKDKKTHNFKNEGEKKKEKKMRGNIGSLANSIHQTLVWLLCSGEHALTLHGFAKALPQLPAMFLKQPVSDVILAKGIEEKNQKYSNNKKSYTPWERVKNKSK